MVFRFILYVSPSFHHSIIPPFQCSWVTTIHRPKGRTNFPHGSGTLTVSVFYNLVGAALFLLGFLALFSQPRLLKKILGINVIGAGLFLLMISTGYDPAGGPTDPVLQALVLTGIVITVSITAFALVLGGGLRKSRDGEKRPERDLSVDSDSGSKP
jgi:multicomponent Na+:H+ antiporter subunit C